MRPRTLHLIVRNGAQPGHRVLALDGVLTLETVPDFVKKVRAETGKVVIVDLAQVSYVDSAGLGALIQAHMHFKKLGSRLVLTAVSQRVQAVLEVTRVHKLFSVFPSVDEAEKHFA